MSIRDEIEARVGEGRLVEFATIPEMSVYRPVYLLPGVNAEIVGPWGDEDEGVQMAYVRADLENFITNGRITTAFSRGPRSVNFRRLSERDRRRPTVWEVRTVNSRPQYRLVGLFAVQNVFIGTELVPRDDMHFEDEQRRAKATWANLFGSYEPVTSENINEYISERVVHLR